MSGFYGVLVAIGVVLVVAGGVIVLGDSDDLSTRMPTQVPPRRFARHPLAAGVVLIVVGLVGLVFS